MDFVESVDKKSLSGQERYAQVAEELHMVRMNEVGEREQVVEVVDGDESFDFKGILNGKDNVEDDAKLDMLSSESI